MCKKLQTKTYFASDHLVMKKDAVNPFQIDFWCVRVFLLFVKK